MTPSDAGPSWDPLGEGLRLDIRETLHPLGFPLRLETNRVAVVDLARESWPARATRDAAPTLLEVIVSDAGPAAKSPRHRGRGRLQTAVADAWNHAAADVEAGRIVCWVTAATLADRESFRRELLEALVYQALSRRFLAPIHASCVVQAGRGILLSGPPRAGKSCLALAFARAGFELLADDVTFAVRESPETLLGSPTRLRLKPGARELFPGLGPLPSGAEALELRPEADLGLSTTGECAWGELVFLERDQAAGLTRMDAEEAVERLVAYLPLADPLTTDAQMRTLRAAASGGAWRLGYTGLQEGVDLLRRIP